MVLVTYDVRTDTAAGAKRLRRVAQICTNYGQRVQNSVFECLVDPAQWVALKGRLMDAVVESDDSLRFYYLGKKWSSRVEHVGAKSSYNPEKPMIV